MGLNLTGKGVLGFKVLPLILIIYSGSERLALPLAERKHYNRIIVLLHDDFDNLVTILVS